MNNTTQQHDKVYILQKDLPNVKAGAKYIHDGAFCYACTENDSHFIKGKGTAKDLFGAEVVENTPEWFLPEQPKEWDILSFMHVDYGIMFQDAQGHFQHVSNCGRGWCISLDEALKNKNMTIHSVKRL